MSELRRTCVEGEDRATMEVFLPRVNGGRIAGQAMTKEQVGRNKVERSVACLFVSQQKLRCKCAA